MNSLRNKPKPTKTFKSYVDIGIREQKENSTPNAKQPAPPVVEEVSPSLLPGEAVITRAEHVLRYNTHSERKAGISGALFCTNFKLAFVTTEQFPSNLHLHNLILGENDICLLNIQAIHHGGRKKRISLQPNSPPSGEEILEVQCKDFSIYQFSFKFTPEGQAKQLVKALTYHTFVDYIQRLFLFDYLPPTTHCAQKPAPPLFTTPQDWQRELLRCGLAQGWRISQANENYQLCDSLPRSIVVPSSILDATLFQAAPYFVGHRVPVWSWGLSGGGAAASLVRMSLQDPAVTDEDHITRMLVESLVPSGGVHLSDLSRDLPSVAEVAESFGKLQELCMPSSTQKFWEQDRHFFVRLEDSHWLTYVSRCLRRSLELARLMDHNTSVVLLEAGSRDLSCVVASLIQLLLDPQARTQQGLQSLLDKEWLALGHPFTDRLGHLDDRGKENSSQSPILLLFLDCVWQLTRQCPASFQFSQTYLTCLWDAAHLSLIDTFLFNCHSAREAHLTWSSSHWDWDLQFSRHNQALFRNPLYVLTQLQGQVAGVYWDHPEDLFSVDPEVRSLELWSQCYLRWIPAAQVIGGGDGVTYLWQRKLAEEVEALSKQLKLRKPHRRMPSDDYLFTTELDSSELRPDNIVMTSAFPFSPLGPWDVRNYVAVPSSSYLHISLQPTDYEDE